MRKTFINFDAVQIINKYQYEDIKEINEKYSKKIKNLNHHITLLNSKKPNFI